MPDSIKAIPSNNPSRFFNPEDKALRGFMGCFLTLNLFPCFPLFSAPVVAAFAFRCITPSYRLSGAFSSFSLYSPSFYSPLRLFRVFFILLFYFPYLTLFSCLFISFFAPVVATFAFRCITPSYRLSCTFSSFSFYSPSFYSPLRLFRVFFILLFYFPYLTLFSCLFISFFAPVVFALFSCSGQKMKTCER